MFSGKSDRKDEKVEKNELKKIERLTDPSRMRFGFE